MVAVTADFVLNRWDLEILPYYRIRHIPWCVSYHAQNLIQVIYVLLSCIIRFNHSSKSKLLYDWQSVSQSVCLGIEHPCGTCDQILLPVGMLLSEICGLVSMGRPFWREDGSAICSVITQWSETLRTQNHTLLSHLRLTQPGRPGSRIYSYIPQEQGGPIIPPNTGLEERVYYNWTVVRPIGT
jgi:hypothetical protein